MLYGNFICDSKFSYCTCELLLIFKLSSITSFEHTPAKNTAMGKRNMRRLVVFVDIMNIRVWHAWDGGQALWRQWGKNFGVKGKGHKIQWIPMLL